MRKGAKTALAIPAVLATGLAMIVATPAGATFKGDNGRVLYISDDASGDQRVYSSTASGERRRIVTPRGLDPGPLAVSPNGRTLAVSGYREGDRTEWIYVGSVKAGRFRKLAKGSEPTFSPNGRKVAYVRIVGEEPNTDYQLRVARLNGKGDRSILRTRGRAWISSPVWTPNGSRIVFDRTPNPNSAPFDQEIFSVRARDGRGKKQLTDDRGLNVDFTNPDVSPNGKRVVFSAYDGALTRRSIATVPVSGGPLDILATPPNGDLDYRDPSYSPDGRRIIFERQDFAFDEYYLIFTARLTGRLPNQSLVTPFAQTQSPAASPFGAFGPVWAPRPR